MEVPRWLNRQTKWMQIVLKTDTLPKWYDVVKRVRSWSANSMQQEVVLKHLLSDILLMHKPHSTLAQIFKEVLECPKHIQLDVFEDGWGFALIDLESFSSSQGEI